MNTFDHPELGLIPGPDGWIGGVDDKVRDTLRAVLTRGSDYRFYDFPVAHTPTWTPDSNESPSIRRERWEITTIRRRDNFLNTTQNWKVAFGPLGQRVAGPRWDT